MVRWSWKLVHGITFIREIQKYNNIMENYTLLINYSWYLSILWNNHVLLILVQNRRSPVWTPCFEPELLRDKIITFRPEFCFENAITAGIFPQNLKPGDVSPVIKGRREYGRENKWTTRTKVIRLTWVVIFFYALTWTQGVPWYAGMPLCQTLQKVFERQMLTRIFQLFEPYKILS